jgi:hypothetical protein
LSLIGALTGQIRPEPTLHLPHPSTGAIIFVTGRWNWLDPAVALVIAVVIGYHAGGLIWRVVGALGIRTRDGIR